MTKGFTLIEMMIVVAIIGIVSAIAIPAYNSYVEVARVDGCTREIRAMEVAEEVFAAQNLTYFAGANTAAIEAASAGYYIRASSFVNGTANCTIVITPGPQGIATQFQITGTGVNKLAGKGVVRQIQNY